MCKVLASLAVLTFWSHALTVVKDQPSLGTDIEEDDPKKLEFEAYQKAYGRSYQHGSKEYWLRRGLYEKRSAAVKAHNSNPERLYEQIAGRFADFTEDERKAMTGYVRQSSSGLSGGIPLSAAAEASRELMRPLRRKGTSMPTTHDWMHLKVAHMIPDQGQCGSCWAVTAKSILDAHHEIYMGSVRNFSAQQIVSCVPNPRQCGGTGGCGGSTVELAMDWVLHNGCADEDHVPYKAADLNLETAKCSQAQSLSSTPSLLQGGPPAAPKDSPRVSPSGKTFAGQAFGMHGWKMLKRNDEAALMQALYHDGPVALSVAADKYFEYKEGILDDCPKDTVVNHAVSLFGYGEKHTQPKAHNKGVSPVLNGGVMLSGGSEPDVKKFWLIRNSWGTKWGEKGFIRMLRVGDGHCGKDTNNQEGTGCKTGKNNATTVTVCGMCGGLWDSVIPHFSKPDSDLMQVDHSGNLIRQKLY